MELHSFLWVGIKLVMTTTMSILNQMKEEKAIWKTINVLFVAIQIFTPLEY